MSQKSSLKTLFEDIPPDKADIYALVLTSSGISHHLIRGAQGWNLLVNNSEYEKALSTIRQYVKENQDFRAANTPSCYEHKKRFTGLWISGTLLTFHLAVTAGNNKEALVRACASSAFHILHGELYRSVTSLMIHANASHLAGNLAGVAIFGNAVCSIAGTGVGILMILASGIAGNLANAVLYQTAHVSVGASTAVFGAIGIMAAHQSVKKYTLPGRRLAAWLPLAAGLALLTILGSAKQTDLTAHFFGFMSGIGIGALYTLIAKRPAALIYQAFSLLTASIIIVLSWITALGLGQN